MSETEDLTKLSRELTDKGKLIEAGWIGLRIAAIDRTASSVQLDEMRMAFFAGAQHLFASIMTIMEPGTQETENDLKRLDLIHYELEEFGKQLTARLATRGNA
jgi:hypothetical protein